VQLQDVPSDLINLDDLEGEPDPDRRDEDSLKRVQAQNEYFDGDKDNDRDTGITIKGDLEKKEDKIAEVGTETTAVSTAAIQTTEAVATVTTSSSMDIT